MKRTNKNTLIFMVVLAVAWPIAQMSLAKSKKNPTVLETPEGREVVLTADLKKFLNKEMPQHRIPADKDFNPKMLKYFYRSLIGIHPAVAWGDFNGDKKRDYALLVITGETPWGPLVELVILNGQKKKGKYEIEIREEVYKFKDDYVSFREGKLYKGRYQQGGWYISWDNKDKKYSIIKS